MTKVSSPPTVISSPNLIQQNFPGLYSFWKFSRPHTIIGTTLSVLGMYLIALSELRQFPGLSLQGLTLFFSWLACICGNIYIVGLNQLQDIEIDQINKPNLPLASGEFSLKQGQLIVAITGILALVVAWLNGPFLLGMVAITAFTCWPDSCSHNWVKDSSKPTPGKPASGDIGLCVAPLLAYGNTSSIPK